MKKINWEERRYELTKLIVHGYCSCPNISSISSKGCVEFANEIIEELKKYDKTRSK